MGIYLRNLRKSGLVFSSALRMMSPNVLSEQQIRDLPEMGRTYRCWVSGALVDKPGEIAIEFENWCVRERVRLFNVARFYGPDENPQPGDPFCAEAVCVEQQPEFSRLDPASISRGKCGDLGCEELKGEECPDGVDAAVELLERSVSQKCDLNEQSEFPWQYAESKRADIQKRAKELRSAGVHCNAMYEVLLNYVRELVEKAKCPA